MSKQNPNWAIANVTNPIPYSASTTGTFPDPEKVIKAEIERLFAELRAAGTADDQAIVQYFNAQLFQLQSIVNGLAGGAELTQALATLQSLKDIVDADGNGILDALGPLNTHISSLAQRMTTAEERIDSLFQATQILSGGLSTHGSKFGTLEGNFSDLEEQVNELVGSSNQNQNAIVGLANTLALNLQAVREGFKTVNVDYTPIALPDPIFPTTNITGNDSTPMDPADI